RWGGWAGGGEAPPAVITVPRGDQATFWELDPEGATGINRFGQRLKLRPFMGIMGMPLDQPGTQSTLSSHPVWRQSRLPRAHRKARCLFWRSPSIEGRL